MDERTNSLVVLQYAPNNCYVQAVSSSEAREKGFVIDEAARVWSSDLWRDIPFNRSRGTHRNGLELREGIIGVYDCSRIDNISSMIHCATEAVRDHGRDSDDD